VQPVLPEAPVLTVSNLRPEPQEKAGCSRAGSCFSLSCWFPEAEQSATEQRAGGVVSSAAAEWSDMERRESQQVSGPASGKGRDFHGALARPSERGW